MMLITSAASRRLRAIRPRALEWPSEKAVSFWFAWTNSHSSSANLLYVLWATIQYKMNRFRSTVTEIRGTKKYDSTCRLKRDEYSVCMYYLFPVLLQVSWKASFSSRGMVCGYAVFSRNKYPPLLVCVCVRLVRVTLDALWRSMMMENLLDLDGWRRKESVAFHVVVLLMSRLASMHSPGKRFVVVLVLGALPLVPVLSCLCVHNTTNLCIAWRMQE